MSRPGPVSAIRSLLFLLFQMVVTPLYASVEEVNKHYKERLFMILAGA